MTKLPVGDDIPVKNTYPPAYHPLIDNALSWKDDYQWFMTETIGRNPAQITGEIDGDPRDGRVYPESPEDKLALLKAPIDPTAGDQKRILGEELSMQMQRIRGERAPIIPPLPPTPGQLDTLLEEMVDMDRDDYTVWIPLESEIIDRTAVGTYRQTAPGTIIRFTIEYDGAFLPFLLLPDASEGGFSWYGLNGWKGGLQNGFLEAEEAQRLKALIRADGSRILTSVPDRIKNASAMLGGYLTPDDPSPTPEGWITTLCEYDEEQSALFRPRYRATFVHKESELVIEAYPEAAEMPLDEIDEGQAATTDFVLKDEAQSEAKPESEPLPSYAWALHFCSPSIEERIKTEYAELVSGEDLKWMMRDISKQLS